MPPAHANMRRHCMHCALPGDLRGCGSSAYSVMARSSLLPSSLAACRVGPGRITARIFSAQPRPDSLASPCPPPSHNVHSGPLPRTHCAACMHACMHARTLVHMLTRMQHHQWDSGQCSYMLHEYSFLPAASAGRAAQATTGQPHSTQRPLPSLVASQALSLSLRAVARAQARAAGNQQAVPGPRPSAFSLGS